MPGKNEPTTSDTNSWEAREDKRRDEEHASIMRDRKADRVAADEAQKCQEHQDKERHENNERRAQEVHKAEMKSKVTFGENSQVLLGMLGQLMETGNKIGDVWLIKYSFSDKEAIRAQACNLIVKAAERNGSEEAMTAAAERLLKIVGVATFPKKPEEAAKAA